VTSKKRRAPYQFWQAGIFGHFWTFGADSFENHLRDIATRSSLDDKLVALTLAFAIYRENGRPAAWRMRLKRLAKASLAQINA